MSSDLPEGLKGRDRICELVSLFLKGGPDSASVLEEATQAHGNVKCLSLLWADITAAWEQSACSCRARPDWQRSGFLSGFKIGGPEGKVVKDALVGRNVQEPS